jgi:micrococcal nuclease
MPKAFKQILTTGLVYIAILLLMVVLNYSGLIYTTGPTVPLQGAAVPFVEKKIETSTDSAENNQMIDGEDIGYISPLYPFAEVIKVIDGDTIKVRTTVGTEEILYTVRLIGVNTPETVDPRRGVECFGKEASRFAYDTLMQKTVRLMTDETQDRFDRYGRLLAYIYLPGTNKTEVLFNIDIIKQGYAFEYTYERSYVYQAAFKTAEKKARNAEIGLWQKDVCPNNGMI